MHDENCLCILLGIENESKDNEEYPKTIPEEYYKDISIETARLLNECIGTTIVIDEQEEVGSVYKAWNDHAETKGLLNAVTNLLLRFFLYYILLSIS